jgi:hypothetical protein
VGDEVEPGLAAGILYPDQVVKGIALSKVSSVGEHMGWILSGIFTILQGKVR